MSILADGLAARGHTVTLITLWSAASDFYVLGQGIQRIALGLAHHSANLRQSLLMTCHRLFRLRKEIRSSRPDVIVSFMDTVNMLTLLATRGLSHPVIVSERVHPAHHEIGWLRTLVRRLLYPHADAIVLPARDAAHWMEAFISNRILHVIANPVRLRRTANDAPRTPGRHTRRVIAMGRLAPQKQFDLLLRAFAASSQGDAEWSLVIIGEGPDRQLLQAVATDLGLTERVGWLGLVQHPEEVLRRADIYVLSSRYEGFPNALVEAMASGLSVVSFDCPSGPGEIIRDGIDGILVPAQDLTALTVAIRRLMLDEPERLRLGSRAVEVTARFAVDKVIDEWEALMRDLLHRRARHAG